MLPDEASAGQDGIGFSYRNQLPREIPEHTTLRVYAEPIEPVDFVFVVLRINSRIRLTSNTRPRFAAISFEDFPIQIKHIYGLNSPFYS
jgi:hypothetical protein